MRLLLAAAVLMKFSICRFLPWKLGMILSNLFLFEVKTCHLLQVLAAGLVLKRISKGQRSVLRKCSSLFRN